MMKVAWNIYKDNDNGILFFVDSDWQIVSMT